ncbi:uncharacterized protein [Watersipora subatra]|uniref:uncharacterized protein n=1 Tax=Watersipora subatra TaxID=2589382 RepID=UPI00355C5063
MEKIGFLVAIFALCGLSAATGDDSYEYHPYYNIDPNYQGEWEVTYKCWMPAEPWVEVDGCLMETETLDYSFGCCLHHDDAGLRLTCAHEGRDCHDGGEYIPANTDEPVNPFLEPTIPPKDIITRGYDETTIPPKDIITIGYDEPDDSKVSVSPIIIIVTVLAGVLLIGGGIICCCNCSTCCKNRPDDLDSLIGPDDLPTPPRRTILNTRPRRGRSLFLRIRYMFVSLQPASPGPSEPASPTKPPSYEDVEQDSASYPTANPTVVQHI